MVEHRSDTNPRSLSIQDLSAWILRLGVVFSVATMLAGMLVSFIHNGMSVERIERSTFDYHPAVILDGVRHGSGKAIVEVGIYMLVFTPVIRVFASMILFIVVERDWPYALITFAVLALTLTGLFLFS
jgi:uncharacterized membrane protein